MASPMGSVVHLFLPFPSLTPASRRFPHSLFASLPTPFISDLDDDVVNKILKFADDTKIVKKVASEYQIKILQSDLHKMFSWSQDWHMRLLVKCGIAARGMRKVQCGMECAENYCWTVGNMRNAESCPVGGRMSFQTGCRLQRWWWGYIGLATFVCSGDLSCKFQLWKLLNFVTGSSIFQSVENVSWKIWWNLWNFQSWNLFLQTDIGSVKCHSHYARIKRWWPYAYTVHGYVYL